MAGGKQSPRDKMIGMMYLVLLALLAMNVTKSVLNSFVVINGAMTETNEAFSGKNEATMIEFNKQNSLNAAKVAPWLKRAKAISEASAELDKYFSDLKKHIIISVEGYSEEALANGDDWVTLDTAEALGDIDKPQTILLGPDPSLPKDGEWTMLEMKSKISEWEEKVLAQIPAKDRGSIDIHFTYEDGVNADGDLEPWHISHFYHAPMAAVITDISMFQNQVKNRESEALAVLMKNITTAEFDFDEIAVKIIPKSNYVVLGDSFKADVIVAAYSTTQNPEMEVGSALDTAGKSSDQWAVSNPVSEDRITIKDGVATYGYKPTSEGEVTWGGIMKIRKAGTDQWELHPFEHTFIAAKPSTVVSPTAMNILYKSIPNPVSVSVGGYAAKDINISVTGGSTTGSKGEYMITPSSSVKKCTINVSVKGKDGKTKSMGTQEFRVKRLPDPNVKFASIIGSGTASKGQISNSPSVKVDEKEMLFDGIKYKVTAFDVVFPSSKGSIVLSAKNNKITPQMKTKFGNLRKGQTVIIKNVKLQLNNDKPRPVMSNIIIEVK